MRMHFLPAVLPGLFEPTVRKAEPKRKAKTAEKSLALSEEAVQRTPPPKQEFDDGEDDHPPGEHLNITV